MKENTLKALITAVLAAASTYFTTLLVPLAALLIFSVIDYITGISAAIYTSTLSSDKGRKGIIKKLSYAAIVAVGIGVDWLVKTALFQAGIDIPIKWFVVGMLVTIWLIINELLSILENVSKTGTKIPKFLMLVVQRLKITVESTAENKVSELQPPGTAETN